MPTSKEEFLDQTALVKLSSTIILKSGVSSALLEAPALLTIHGLLSLNIPVRLYCVACGAYLKCLFSQNNWTLWFFKNDRNKSWEENQRPIITFSTVEDFWALYNHIEQASKLNAGCDYSLFKVSSLLSVSLSSDVQPLSFTYYQLMVVVPKLARSCHQLF